MKHQEGYFNDNQNQSVFYQYWFPDRKIKAVFLICHGLNEHSGRYEHLGKYFNDERIGVFGFDHIGHGRSDGTRSYVRDYPTFIDPMLKSLELINELQPNAPIFIVGHSMGGLIGASFLIDHQEKVSGAILSGSLVMVPDYVSDLTVKIGEFLSKFLPKLRLIGIDIESISRDPEVVKNYISDPLVFTGKSTARISSVMNEGINHVTEKGSAITAPIMLLHGGKDRICDPSYSTYLHNLVSSQENQLIIYDDLFHEIYNEPEQELVFQDILNWVKELL